MGSSGGSDVRVACLVTHPIQYQAPLLRRLAEEPHVSLKVFFASDLSVGEFSDPGFGRVIKWNVPLLEGYEYKFLPALWGRGEVSFWKPVSYGLAARLKRGRFDFLWVHGYSRWSHLLAMLTAKRLGTKVLVRDEVTAISGRTGGVSKRLKHVFCKALGLVCDGFLAIGTLNKRYYLSHGIDEGRIFDVPYAVDNVFFQRGAQASARTRSALRASLRLEGDTPVILYVGKLTERKGVETLLEAFHRLQAGNGPRLRACLVFVGDGALRKRLEGSASLLGLKSVRFVGFKNQTELPQFYDLCDVFVLPSMKEPWGLVVNEAMNAARAVVVSDQVGCGPDLVKDGENGRVFRAGDPAGLCDALFDVLSDRGRCAAMGQKSLELIGRWDFESDVAGLKAAFTTLGADPVERRCARAVRGRA